MTPQEAIKFREQIAYFIEHPEDGMLYRAEDSWDETRYPKWLIYNEYVIPDKYQELRMALADGKQIEFYNKCYDKNIQGCGWVPASKINKSIEVKHYRIKPEEPKIKEGDWVVLPDGKTMEKVQKDSMLAENYNPGSRFKLWKPITGTWVNVVRDDGIIFSTKKLTHYDDGVPPPNGYIYEPWIPKVGEWVACSDDKFKYEVKQFIDQDEQWFLKVEPLEAIALLKDK